MRKSVMDEMTGRLEAGLRTAEAKGAGAAKLSFSHVEAVDCKFEAGRLKAAGSRESFGYTVEVLVDGRSGMTGGNDPAKLDEMIERAIVLSSVGRTAHFDAYPAPGEVTGVDGYSERTLALSREDLIEASRRMNDAFLAYDSDLHTRLGAMRNETESAVVTSGGVRHTRRGTAWNLGGGVQRTRGTDVLFAGDGRSWRELNEFWDPQAVIDRVLGDVRAAETNADAPAGRVALVVPPEMLEMLLRPVFMGINGRSVAKGDSPLKGRLGEQILSPAITMEDNPHVPFATRGAEIDADGLPTRRQTLFERGVLKRFLYDLDSAGLAGAEPTGNAGCSPYSVFVRPGERPSAEMLAGVEDGVLIRGLIGFGQSNIINGDFSCNVALGYRVRKGELVGRVKNTMISGNLYDLLAGEVELSRDTEHEGRLPWAVIGGVNVSAQG